MRKALLLLALLSAVPAQAADPKIPHERYTLPNGLEVILMPDHTVPLVAVDVWFHVGAGNETLGKSGYAHLFEHMMFAGSEHIARGVADEILARIGSADNNGSTSTDRTNYYEVVPAHQIETALWIESDRMGYLLPGLDEKALATQIDVVRNERRQSYEDAAYGAEYLEMGKALYAEGHPYRTRVIGLHEDLAKASLGDVRGFFERWYGPSNATLVVGGDFDPATAKALVEKWFGGFPKIDRPARPRVEPTKIASPVRVVVVDKIAKLARVHYAWHSPALFAPGDAELDVLAQVLGREGTGRLYRLLVVDKGLAQNVAVYQDSQEMSSTFEILVDLLPGVEPAAVEALLDAEIERVRTAPVPAPELTRAVTGLVTGTIWSLEGLLARVERLQTYNHYLGDPDGITRDLDRYRLASPEKVEETARQYLAPESRVEVVTQIAGGK